MLLSRSAGLLLHPTSLPGPGGIGSIGADAYRFVDTLVASGIRVWQILPLSPTGYGDSPYAALSAFAGNPLLIALEPLAERGWLEPADLDSLPSYPLSVDFGAVIPAKFSVLRRAFSRFAQEGAADPDFADFQGANRDWLDDFALFMALKDAHGGAPWNDWEEPLRLRRPEALQEAAEGLRDDVAFHRFLQFIFFQQWGDLKRYTNEHGVSIVGDMPIFVAYDSADVWAHQEEFRLNPDGTPEVVAGVPPDYFSATGQLWGNPHYRWDVMRGNGFRWWVERFHMIWQTVDLVRLDHFRAFAAAWAIPYGDPTAERGTWAPGPSAHLFNAVDAALGELPIIAEDLGVITPDVAELRDHFRFPGMKVLQFAFASDWNDPYLPHNFIRNCVVYTGTHDNDTTVGWFTSLEDEERVRVCRYTGTKGIDISWDFIHLALASVADLAIFPLQDVLRLGSAARMNAPGSLGGNWRWRFTWDDITDAHIRGLRLFNETYGRMGGERRDLPTLLGPAGASGEP